MGWFLVQWDVFTCPKTTLLGVGTCFKHPVFVKTHFMLPMILSEWLSYIWVDWVMITLRPSQLYAVIFAIFASTIAPFGGFLASGFKVTPMHSDLTFR